MPLLMPSTWGWLSGPSDPWMTAPRDALFQLPATPGTYCIAVMTLAEPGSAWMRSEVRTVCCRTLTTSTSGETPVTVTVS